MNRLLSGIPDMANGVCNVTLDDSPVRERMDESGEGSSKKTPAANKTAFEKELIPTILLALDGVLPAIESLKTASTLRKTAALFKLLSKVIRSD